MERVVTESRAPLASFAGPLSDSYWAEPDRFLAGPCPASEERDELRRLVRLLLGAGIRTVIDLRTPAELPSVRVLFEKLAPDDAPVSWIAFPILDGAAPTAPQLELVLDLVDASLARECPVYVHCAGGRGRTGTVVACWWIRHGVFEPEAALAELMRRRIGQPHGERPSPETGPQYRLVRSWTLGR
jgi:hypothetical protein